jgi:hypothetical protein
MQLERAINECRREYNILIDSQKGILRPHILTPAQIIKQMKASQADTPSELSLPIPLSAAYQNLVLRIMEFVLLVKGNFLVYVIRLPLTNHMNCNVYPVLPLLIMIKNTDIKFTFILPEREYLLMDVAKQYYARLKIDRIKECKLINSYHRVSKQNNPVQVTHVHEECEVEMLQSTRTLPSSCSQRVVEINQTVWTQMITNGCMSLRDQVYLLYCVLNMNPQTLKLWEQEI